jgi:hypothetical protein
MLYEYFMRTRKTTSQLLSACGCALTIIAATLTLMADPAAAAVGPTITVPGGQTVASNAAIRFKGASLISVADPDSPKVELELLITGGFVNARPTLTLASTAGLTFENGDGRSDQAMTFSASPGNVNQALNGMELTAGFEGGPYQLTVTATDPTLLTTTQTIDVTVTDEPIFVSALADTRLPLGAPKTVTPVVTDADSPVLHVSVTISTITGTPTERPTFTLATLSGLTLDTGSGTASRLTVFHGSRSAVTAALATVTLTAGAGTGTSTLTIAAQDSAAASPNKAVSTATLTQVTLPSAPTAITAKAFNGSAKVTWSPPSTAGTLPTTGYRVTPFKGGVAQASSVVDADQTEFFDFGLTNATPYRFEIVAVNGDGSGPAATSATVTPQVFFPFTSANAEIDRLYRDLLGRAPTAAERAAGVASVAEAGRASDLVASLRAGPESASTVDPVTRLYRAYLLRIPDAGGLNFWLAKKRAGTKLDTISQSFATSNEFKTRYGSLTNKAFVELIYRNLFDRDGDAAGIAFWTAQLDTKARTRGRVMTGFSESNEYRTKQQSEVDVSVLFIAMLGRAPTTSEFTNHVIGLDLEGETVESIARDILNSGAYASRVG